MQHAGQSSALPDERRINVTRLTWGETGTRLYETGIDRGVLYVDNEGTAWNGLTSVDESPSGGEAKAYYIDGTKYLNVSASEEFEGTINAFYSPAEFDQCDGSLEFHTGLSATQQRRAPFGLSYRTMLGNDVDGTDHAYKIHIIYNALAAPVQKAHATISESVDPSDLSWSITTKPAAIPGKRPSAHIVIDSSRTSLPSVRAIEAILYGNDADAPRLPSPFEIQTLLSSPPVAGTLTMTMSNTSASGTVTGASGAVGLHTTPYAFKVDVGGWSTWQSSATFSFTGRTPSTSYRFQHKVRDADFKESVGTAITKSTTAS